MLPTVAAALLIAAVQVVQVAGAYTPWVSMSLRDDAVYLLMVYVHCRIFTYFIFLFSSSLNLIITIRSLHTITINNTSTAITVTAKALGSARPTASFIGFPYGGALGYRNYNCHLT